MESGYSAELEDLPWAPDLHQVREEWARRAQFNGFCKAGRPGSRRIEDVTLEDALEGVLEDINVEFPFREQFINPFVALRGLPVPSVRLEERIHHIWSWRCSSC